MMVRLASRASLVLLLSIVFASGSAAGAPPTAPAPPGAPALTLPGDSFVRVAATYNTTGNRLHLDHPAANLNPAALVFVTQVRSPLGAPAVVDQDPIAVAYDTAQSRWDIVNLNSAPIAAGTAFEVSVAIGGNSYLHTATAANTTGSSTYLDHPLLNGNRSALAIVTQNMTPNGAAGTPDNHHIGLWYSTSAAKWAVFNEDEVAMPVGAAFNVFVYPPGGELYMHTAASGNVIGGSTILNHPLLNGNPAAQVHVTRNWNGNGGPGVYNNHPITAWYRTDVDRWAILNEDGANMLPGTRFNILVYTSPGSALLHTVTAANLAANCTYIDDPVLNGNMNARVFVTPNWNPPGSNGVYDNQPLAVFYGTGHGQWAICNLTNPLPALGAAFNVWVPPASMAVYTHIARAQLVYYSSTQLDHPALNGNPNAIFFVTQNIKPNGWLTSQDQHPIAVHYSSLMQRWEITNSDSAPMDVDSAFNVAIMLPGSPAYTHAATAANTSGSWTTLDHPPLNGHPEALSMVTQCISCGGGTVTDQRNFGVWYTSGHWAIFNEDESAMPIGAHFNVLEFTPKVLVPAVLLLP